MHGQPGRDHEFTTFVAAQRGHLLRMAVLMSAGDTHFAEDVVQTTLTKLYVAWPRVKRADDPLAYARRALSNSVLDEGRRAHRRRERSGLPEPTTHVLQPDRDLRPALQDALAALPARQRAVVVLRHWVDLDVAETARLLGCSPGTVKSQTSKALAGLREALGSDLRMPADDHPDPIDQTDTTDRRTPSQEETACPT